MPRYSEARGVMLLTFEECVETLGVPVRTLRRRVRGGTVYAERHRVPRPGIRGATLTLFIDPATLRRTSQLQQSFRVPHDSHKGSECQFQSATQVQSATLPSVGTETQELGEVRQISKVSECHSSSPQPHRITIHSDSPHRTDKGAFRLPPEQYQLAVHGLVNNRDASTRMLHRILKRACDLQISESTLRRIRDRLETDPRTRLMFVNADDRKEFLRTYAGQVFAAHANAMWQLDMTRCDILVYDDDLGRVIRPRVHAIIDVYSGCFVSLVFSVREDQSQTDAAIVGGLIPKTGSYGSAWPVFGTPEVIYMDNGKTYKSEHVHRYLADLGVEVIHSRPLTSHTRGKVERGFGTMHGYTKPMPGYCGSNAKDRATEELKRLTKKTLKWVERGMTPETDPGWNERLLTLTEYRDYMLAAILTDYHDTVVHGKSRLQHFLETAPAISQRLYDEKDLMLAIAKRTARTVNPDGSVRFGNRFWTVESGELANFRGLEVLVLSNPATPDVPYLIAWEPPQGGVEIIGRAEAMPERADSDEARLLRANSKAAKKRELQRQTQEKQEMLNDHLAIPKLLAEQARAELNIAPLPPVQRPTARLEAISGPAEPDAEPEDDLMRFLLEDTTHQAGMSADEYHEASKERWRKKGRK